MKYLAFLLLISLGCTPMQNANTLSYCPCQVVAIEQMRNVSIPGTWYKITMMDAQYSKFTFRSKHLYNLGDTIK